MIQNANPGRPDAELIARFLQAQDADAFRDLYRRHSPAVYGLICRLTGGHAADAADILQNTWVRAARGMHDFRGAAQFRTWLTGIALNCYREWRRAAAVDAQGSVDDDRLAALEARIDPRRAEINQVVEALPPAYREVLVLHDVEGYTHEQIAEALGIELGTSKSRLARAHRLFRAWWQHDRSAQR